MVTARRIDLQTLDIGKKAIDATAIRDLDGALRGKILEQGSPAYEEARTVCRRLRARTGEGQPLIVAMTGYGQEEDRRRSEEAGFDAHMVKPVDLEALQELLSRPELVRRGPG